MKTLALRIYLTVVAVLLVFALVSGWLAQHNIEHERAQTQSITAWNERAAAWAELLENSLPTVDAPRDQQALVFLDWADRLRLPMALDDPQGRRIATSQLLADRLQRRPELLERMQVVAREGKGRTLEDAMAEIAAANPQHRIIQPGEVASLAAYLCRDDARGITAENIQITGGALW